MISKALRGLSGLARKFDAWMTQKPKTSRLPTSAKDAKAKALHHYMDVQAFSLRGGIREHGSLPHDRWMNP